MEILKDKIRELQLRRLKAADGVVRKGNAAVPAKKKSKPVGYKMQNTFEKNLRGLPGGGFGGTAVIRMAEAKGTGTKVRKEGIGVRASARNANTTQGSYIRTEVRENGRLVSDAQGRKNFGR
jgi:hypothetical protein